LVPAKLIEVLAPADTEQAIAFNQAELSPPEGSGV